MLSIIPLSLIQLSRGRSNRLRINQPIFFGALFFLCCFNFVDNWETALVMRGAVRPTFVLRLLLSLADCVSMRVTMYISFRSYFRPPRWWFLVACAVVLGNTEENKLWRTIFYSSCCAIPMSTSLFRPLFPYILYINPISRLCTFDTK